MTLQNTRFLQALKRQPVDQTPIWLMRQAGRYLPEYRKVRAKAGDFITLCSTPELACEVTLQPIDRYELDAAIIFSDILTIPDAMGCGLYFVEGEGPKFKKPVRTAADVAKLGVPDPEAELGYVMDAIRVTKRALHDRVPLIGFSGSPWTLATYMVEGQSSRDFKTIKAWMYQEPVGLLQLLDLLADSVIVYLKAQIAAGADAVQIFDTWGGVLTTTAYHEFSLNPMAKIVRALKADPKTADTPIILFTKGGGQWLRSLAATGCDGLSIDWGMPLSVARHQVGDRVALQGNLDPAVLYGSPDRICQEVASIFSDVGDAPGHIFNLGHGITPSVDPEHVQCLIDAVRGMSSQV